ncbi:MAG TPA: hypothetical protein VHE83_07900 [Mycobacteriales bacterium]|nr:hypothetical protein [Mycobacteriales bacterium]
MITLLEPATWTDDGHVDGVIRDVRQPLPDDGLLPGAVVRMGDDVSGPVVAMYIRAREFPRKAPVHLHKSDSFRMALGEPIRVAGATYAHGEFRLQSADTFYGPEHWSDDVGTNQLLLMADRRGLKPYLTDVSAQRLADAALADDVSLEGVAMHDRDAIVPHAITNGFGATLRTGHFDAGFTDTSTWPPLPDGTRVAVIALGDPRTGPLVLGFDRPSGGAAFPAFRLATDLIRLQVEGSADVGDRAVGRLGFRLQQSGSEHAASRPGPAGSKELWILADRTAWPPAWGGPADTEALTALDALVTPVLAAAAA